MWIQAGCDAFYDGEEQIGPDQVGEYAQASSSHHHDGDDGDDDDGNNCVDDGYYGEAKNTVMLSKYVKLKYISFMEENKTMIWFDSSSSLFQRGGRVAISSKTWHLKRTLDYLDENIEFEIFPKLS